MTDSAVALDRRGDIAVVTIDHPPVNATGQAVRAGLLRALGEVAADLTVRGAVLACAGRTFVAGADIAEFGRPPVEPSLRDCCTALDRLAKPVVALLHGTALGGGLELALACPYRVMDPDGWAGLPEVTLGLIPGAGGTQRLPRLVGLAPALDMITSGRRVGAAEALQLGLVDALTAGERLPFAIAFLRERLDGTAPRLSKRPFPAVTSTIVAEVRGTVARRSPGQIAPGRAIDVIEASAGLDMTAGERLEQRAFGELRSSAQAAALRHIFFAERVTGRMPATPPPRPIDRIGVVGAGTMGTGIAAACLLAGLTVRLIEQDAAALAAGKARIEGILADAVRRGKLSPSEQGAIGATRLLPSVEFGALADADLIVEAVYEAMDVKSDVFRALDGVARPGAVLATNTSYLNVGALAAVTGRPGDVIGLHFFSPAHAMKLLELVVPDAASPDTVATGFALARRLGKIAVRAGDREGFIGNRILSAYRRAADQMVEDGASPWDVDAAFVAFGFPMGLYAMQDLAGLDIGWATRKRLAPTRDPAERYVGIADRLCEQGWFGRKAGRGYYLYESGRITPNPAVEAIVADERRAKGIVPRPFTREEIQGRILFAMINEGAKVLDAGVARRAGDVDVVMVNGYGFPRWRGGPMHEAVVRGLPAVQADLEALEGADPLWRRSALLDRLAASGGQFDEPR